MEPIDDTVMARWAGKGYAAAAGTGAWSDLLADMATHVGALGAALFTPPAVRGASAFAAGWGNVTTRSMLSYFGHWHVQDPWNSSPRLAELFSRAGELRHGHEFIDDNALRRTDFFNAVSRPNGGGRLLCLKVCGDEGVHGAPMHLSLLRSLADRPVDDQALLTLRRFHPYLQAAVGCSRHLATVIPASSPVDSRLLDDLPQGLWLLRADGWVAFANRAARELAAARMAFGHLVQLGTLDRSSLLEELRKARARRGGGFRLRLEFGDPMGGGWLRLSALAEGSRLCELWPQAQVLASLETGDPDRQPHRMSQLRLRYALTASETAVLDLLGRGLAVPAIAAARGISPVTVRSHLRALFEKTGLHRQAELVRLVAGLEADAGSGRPAPP